jgi:hypothetical protein
VVLGSNQNFRCEFAGESEALRRIAENEHRVKTSTTANGRQFTRRAGSDRGEPTSGHSRPFAFIRGSLASRGGAPAALLERGQAGGLTSFLTRC